MRVVYVCSDPGVPEAGRKGASAHLRAVLRALVEQQHDVHLVTVTHSAVALDDDADPGLAATHVHHVARERADSRAQRELCIQQADARVADVLDRLHTDQPLDLVYERYSLWGRTAMPWAAANAVRSILEVNAPLPQEQAAHRTLAHPVAAERSARRAIGSAGVVVCVSDPVAAWARMRATDGSRVHTLANGVDTVRVCPSTGPVAPATGTPFTVGFVGTLKPWHGVDALVDAFTLLVGGDLSYRLLLVGDGPTLATLRSQVERAGIRKRVEMTGAAAPGDVPRLLRRMDVAVAPYPPSDSFYFSPLKVYEYLAAGVPVVASRVGHLPAVLDHGRLGELVEPGDVEALAAAIASLRAEPRRRLRLRREGRRRAVERHDWSRVVRTALSLAAAAPPVPRAFAGRHSEEASRAVAR